ncbi:MAG TPA: glycoside hydrolase family 88 protein [Opitutaceae bacterium]
MVPCLLLTAIAPVAVAGAMQPGGVMDPAAVLEIMERVADWQLANPSAHPPTDWTQATGYAGIMALARISSSPRYLDAMVAMGEQNEWKPGPVFYLADDHAVGQTYAELYLLRGDPKVIAPLRQRFDAILARPYAVPTLQYHTDNPDRKYAWTWCDALFMAPPAWMRLYAATKDTRYLDFAIDNWLRTSDYLYEEREHLYFRDSTQFAQREANGRKVMWGRGNGWAMAGLARVLEYLPEDHAARPRLVQQFRQMAAKIAECQQPDGLWRASLLDPANCPRKETSGSGLLTFALAWGVNHGLINRERFLPVVARAWTALAGAVTSEGRLTHVQPIGSSPKDFDPDSTEIYGVGAFLLAGSEVHRLAGVANAPVATGGGIQPELPLHYPPGYMPPAGKAEGTPLNLPAGFSGSDLLAVLRPEHPRLFASDRDWEAIRGRIPASPHLDAARRIVIAEAEGMLAQSVSERVMTGRRMLAVSRQVLHRVMTLGTAYKVTGDRRYLDRARGELICAASFSDWNPSHFLDVAEMTMALAIGYDWLYHDLSVADRTAVRQAILEKGLGPGTGPPEGINYWKLKDNNWVQVCFAGMVAGALAVAEDEPELAATFLQETFHHIHQSLDAYRPDGAFPEGPGYWSYATHYSVMLISILESACGTAWNLDNYPGFQASAVYINATMGPSGKFFNYSDGDDRDEPMPALHWFAARAQNAAIDARERTRLLDADSAAGGSPPQGRFFPLTLLWLDPAVRTDDAGAALPLHWSGDGLNPIAIHRSGRDRDALFLGIKGGSPSNNHGHMDIGSFVLDWKGVRWALDFGSQDYNSLESLGMRIWGYKDPSSQRWDVFRINSQSHNTLVIGGQPQRIDGFAPIVAFSDSPQSPFTVLDMSTVYSDSVSRALRGVRLVGEGAVLIHDQLEGLEDDKSVRWGMATEAGVELHGDRALLRLDGKMLHARIISPAGARFSIVPTDPPPNSYDAPNPGTRMLAVLVEGADAGVGIRILFSAEEPNAALLGRIRALPPPSEWRTGSSRESVAGEQKENEP